MRNDILWLWLGIRGEFRGNRCAREKSRGWNLGDVAQKCDIYGEKVRENNCILNDLGIYLTGQTSPLQVTVYSYISTIFVIYLFRLIINIPGDVDDNCGNPFSWNMFLPRSPNPLIPFQLLQTFEVFILIPFTCTLVLKSTLSFHSRSVLPTSHLVCSEKCPHAVSVPLSFLTARPSHAVSVLLPDSSARVCCKPWAAANNSAKKCVLQQKVPKTTVNRHWYSDLKLLADEIYH